MRIDITPEKDPDLFALCTIKNILRKLTKAGRSKVISYLMDELDVESGCGELTAENLDA